jgi:hypothetical protein
MAERALSLALIDAIRLTRQEPNAGMERHRRMNENFGIERIFFRTDGLPASMRDRRRAAA